MKRSSRDHMTPLIASIKVVGIGGGGSNAVARMSKDFMRGVEFIAINTDHQDLDHSAAGVKKKIYVGKNLTRGLGTGMNPDLGRQAAEENRSEIAEAVKGADIVFIAAGMGGGTGTGASPVVAETAKQSGALTIAVVTRPFSFEGSQRERIAQEGLGKLKDKVDALIVVPNDKIFSIISKDTPIMKAFQAIDDVLRNALHGIVELVLSPGIVNVDFADVRTIVQDAGSAIVGIGMAAGPDRAVKAVNQALHSPLLEVSAEGAVGVLLGITGGKDLKMAEINDAAKLVAQTVDPNAKIIFGAYHDKNLKENQIKITLIATGFTTNTSTSSSHSLFTPSQSFFDTAKNNPVSSVYDPVSNPSRSTGSSSSSEFHSAAGKSSPLSSFPDPSMSSSKQSSVQMNVSKSADAGKSSPSTANTSPLRSASNNSDVTKFAPRTESFSVMKKKEDDPDGVWDIPAFLRRRKK